MPEKFIHIHLLQYFYDENYDYYTFKHIDKHLKLVEQ